MLIKKQKIHLKLLILLKVTNPSFLTIICGLLLKDYGLCFIPFQISHFAHENLHVLVKLGAGGQFICVQN